MSDDAAFARFLLADEEEGASVSIRPDAVLAYKYVWQDTWGDRGGYHTCYLYLDRGLMFRVLGTEADIQQALETSHVG